MNAHFSGNIDPEKPMPTMAEVFAGMKILIRMQASIYRVLEDTHKKNSSKDIQNIHYTYTHGDYLHKGGQLRTEVVGTVPDSKAGQTYTDYTVFKQKGCELKQRKQGRIFEK